MMEIIKTTNEIINERHPECIKKWVCVESLVKYLEDWKQDCKDDRLQHLIIILKNGEDKK